MFGCRNCFKTTRNENWSQKRKVRKEDYTRVYHSNGSVGNRGGQGSFWVSVGCKAPTEWCLMHINDRFPHGCDARPEGKYGYGRRTRAKRRVERRIEIGLVGKQGSKSPLVCCLLKVSREMGVWGCVNIGTLKMEGKPGLPWRRFSLRFPSPEVFLCC